MEGYSLSLDIHVKATCLNVACREKHSMKTNLSPVLLNSAQSL